MDSVTLVKRRGYAPVSGRERSRSLRWLTNAYLFSATLKTTIFAVVAGGSLAGMPFASKLVRGLNEPYWVVLGLAGIASTWITYHLLRVRRKSAVFAAGIPVVMGLISSVRSVGRQFDIGDVILGLGMLLLLLRAYEDLD